MPPLRQATPRLEIAARLKIARHATGMTQDQLADALNISRYQYRNLESGYTSLPSERLVDIAAAAKIGIHELLGVSA
jgi:transcriptional regulator with XRE-family HTH domain